MCLVCFCFIFGVILDTLVSSVNLAKETMYIIKHPKCFQFASVLASPVITLHLPLRGSELDGDLYGRVICKSCFFPIHKQRTFKTSTTKLVNLAIPKLNMRDIK